jgi:hypothetical protein
MMSHLVNFLVDAVLALSLLTLLLAILALLSSKRKQALKTIAAITGLLTALGTISLKATGARVSTPDEARQTIADFYRDVGEKSFSQAYDLIDPARKDEMKQQHRDYDDFKNAYASTREYRNLQISFDKQDPPLRWYLVAYDVKDAFPLSTLCEESWLPSNLLMDSGLINQQKLAQLLVSDLKREYVLPDSAVPKVLAYTRRAPAHFIFEPSFTKDVADFLHLNSKQASGKESWSHHIEYLTMQQQGGWKIRGGLYPPLFVAQYPPRTEPPVLLKSTTENQ